MVNAFLMGVVSVVPAAVFYYALRLRISEVETALHARVRRIDDRVEFLSEEIYDYRAATQTKTLSTSAPAVMMSAPKPKSKRTRKPK